MPICQRVHHPMTSHCAAQVQDVPTDFVAAGYAALCEFFSGQSNTDPRQDMSFFRKKPNPDKKDTKPQRASKPKKRTADVDVDTCQLEVLEDVQHRASRKIHAKKV